MLSLLFDFVEVQTILRICPETPPETITILYLHQHLFILQQNAFFCTKTLLLIDSNKCASGWSVVFYVKLFVVAV